MRLPDPYPAVEGSFEAILEARRSIREFSGQPVNVAQAGQLLWAAQGITACDGRTAPSAGGIFPLTLSLVAGSVEGLDAGVYCYEPTNHSVDRTTVGDLRSALGAAAIGLQPWLATAALIIVIAADLDRAVDHFAEQPPKGERGRRYAHIEVGHAAQNVYLQATALGLGAVFVGGFDDDTIRALDPPLFSGRHPLGLLAVGHPASAVGLARSC